MQNRALKILLPLSLLVLAVVVSWMMVNSREPARKRESKVVVPVVELLKVAPGPVTIDIKTRGTVAARRHIQLVSEVSGKVVSVAPEFVAGALLPAGTELLRIDPIDYEVALAQAEANVASAELALKEVRVLVKKAAEAEVKAKLNAAQVKLRQARADLNNTVIKAPYDVVVQSKAVDLAQFVNVGTSLASLYGSGAVEVRLPLVPADVPYVNVGQREDGQWYEVTLQAVQGHKILSWPARLVRFEQLVDSTTQVSYVVAQVDQPYDSARYGQVLPVGQFVTAILSNAVIPSAIRLPRNALHEERFVFVFKEGKLRETSVEVIRADGDTVVIGAGLKAGDDVVVSRLGFMVDGMAVIAHEK